MWSMCTNRDIPLGALGRLNTWQLNIWTKSLLFVGKGCMGHHPRAIQACQRSQGKEHSPLERGSFCIVTVEEQHSLNIYPGQETRVGTKSSHAHSSDVVPGTVWSESLEELEGPIPWVVPGSIASSQKNWELLGMSGQYFLLHKWKWKFSSFRGISYLGMNSFLPMSFRAIKSFEI